MSRIVDMSGLPKEIQEAILKVIGSPVSKEEQAKVDAQNADAIKYIRQVLRERKNGKLDRK